MCVQQVDILFDVCMAAHCWYKNSSRQHRRCIVPQGANIV